MASNSPAKSSSSSPYKNVQGYIHAVSEIRTPANPNSSRYFEFTVQENDEKTRVVCFNTENKVELKRREQHKLPTCLTSISPQKKRYSDGVEYKMNKYSRIEPAKNLEFQWKSSNTNRSEMTVTQLLQSTPNGQSVGLKAKVLFKGEKETVYSKTLKKNITKCDLVVADSTGAITVTLWESQIDQVEQDSCYNFKELKLNFFNKIYLSSSISTTIEQLNENIDIPTNITSEAGNLKPSEKVTTPITGTVLAVDIKKTYICVNCKSKIPDDPDKGFVKCPKCNLTIKKGELLSNTTGVMMIKDEDGQNMGRFFCQHAVLSSLFETIANAPGFSIDKNIDNLSSNTMELTLLNASKLLFQVITNEKIVKSITI